jgi:hypothetical protein
MLLILGPILQLFNMLFSYNVNAVTLESDPLNSFYYSSGYNVYRINVNGQQTGSHTSRMFGNVSSIDAVNPMKTLVYYKDFNTIVFLDNFMNPVGEPVKLQELGLERVSAVCSSYNNALWVYDSGSNELIRLDAQSNILYRTGRLQQSTGFIPEPLKMIEWNNKLYMNDPTYGILTFDIYGAYLGIIPIKGIKDFTVNNGNVVYVSNDTLHSYNQKFMSDTTFALPEKNVLAVRYINDKVMIRTADRLSLYQRLP